MNLIDGIIVPGISKGLAEIDLVTIYNRRVQATARNFSQSFAQPLGQELKNFTYKLFDEKLDPFLGKINYKLKERIDQIKHEGITIVEYTVKSVSELKDEIKGDVDNLIANVDKKYHNNLILTFDKINQARAETILDLRKIIGEVDKSVEDKITQISIFIMTALKEATVISDKFTPEKFQKDLIVPTFERIDKLETKFFQDLDESFDKFAAIVDLNVDDIKNKFLASITFQFVEQWYREEIGRVGIFPLPTANLTDMELYRYFQRRELKKIDDFVIRNSSIELIVDTYLQLQMNASRMHLRAKICKMKDLQLMCTKDWLNYGQSSKFWSSR